MYNLAWKGGSGIAAKQYETFKDWTNTPYQTSTVTEIDEFTRVVDSTSNAYWVSMINRTSDFDKVHDSINIVLYQDDMLLVHECKYKIDENVTTKALYETLKSGVNTITLATIDKFTDIPEDAEIMSLGEWVNPKSNKGSVKITLLPSYEGGVLLDGINDFGKVTGMPIYKDYTFIIDYERISYASSERWVAGVVSKSHVANQGAFILMTANTTVEPGKQAYSFGGVTSFNRDDFTRALVYQSKYKCGDVDLTVGEGVDSNTLWLGTFRDNDQRFFNGAIYSLMSFPYSMSKFLIERQLKKYKLGTLYPDMVEFRPVINSNVLLDSKPTFVIRDTSTYLNAGDYVPENSQIIEKVKVVPEGYNGAGMDGMYGRRDVNGKANAGLTLGIIGTALGAWALFGNRRSAGVLGTGAGLMGDGSTNINVVGVGAGNGTAPTAFQAWAKSCEDTLALQGGLYQWALTQQSQRFQDRQVIDGEMFGLYKSQIDADFSLYKGQRDNYDALKAQIDELKTQVAVGAAIRPYQDKLIQCEIEKAFTAGINYVDKKTCNVIYGVTCLPNEPTTTGLVGRNANGCLPCGFTQTASTPAT